MQFMAQLEWPAAVGARGLSWLWKRSRRVAVAAVVVVAVVKRWDAAGQDVVVLHMFGRGRHLPNLSPFVLKLETYLRMTDIKYECMLYHYRDNEQLIDCSVPVTSSAHNLHNVCDN
ncbi:Failed axon connections [Portunus trituberculatus]|uniref:Failed axon connections n=1 Tax=Portunus trituberculatus TaxID=210409 RepID=A0A5B7CL88_PORTR|nr:Failed axon connections [Portunus trituberculatus]